MAKQPEQLSPEEQAAAAEKKARRAISRRRFLMVLGGGVGVLAVGAVLGGPTLVREARLAINQAFLTGAAPSGAPPKSPFVWFEITADNIAHLYIPKIEMGQGIHTALTQIAADELELDWAQIQVHQADSARGFDGDLMFTFGSTSVTAMYQPIREIAATLREMLRAEAAAQMGRTTTEMVAVGSAFEVSGAPETRITYGKIITDKQGEWSIPGTVPALKANSDFRYIGTSAPRVDLREKVTGRAIYGYDVRVEGMVYGAVARPPRYGAKLKSATAGDAETQPGVIAVVIQDGFAGVIASARTQAQNAILHLALEWEGGTTISQAEIDSIVSVPAEGGTLIQRDGDVTSAANSKRIEARYRTPMAVHAQLEPQAAMATVTADSAVVYASTQAPGLTREKIALALKLDEAKIEIIPTYVGGAFGRKTGADVGVEAALLAKATGRPVHVGWTREEDMKYGYRRPPAANHLWATLDGEGNLTALHHGIASSDVLFNPEVGGGGFLETLLGADPLAAYGGLIHYNIPNRRVIYHTTRVPVPTAYWRGLGSFANTFASESFMDEIAFEAGIDPLEFRLRYKPEGDLGARYEAALTAASQLANWATPPAPGRGRGVAVTYDRGTVVALIVEVSGDEQRIRVHHAWCAVDPGLVINPDGAIAQVQGSIIMGISSALYERQVVENGMATNQNFNDYPLARMTDAPTIDVALLSSDDTPIGGMGEPVIGAVPAAISNAVFALMGLRLREMPFTLG